MTSRSVCLKLLSQTLATSPWNDLMREPEWVDIYHHDNTGSVHSLSVSPKQPSCASDLRSMLPLSTPDILHPGRFSLLSWQIILPLTHSNAISSAWSLVPWREAGELKSHGEHQHVAHHLFPQGLLLTVWWNPVHRSWIISRISVVVCVYQCV